MTRENSFDLNEISSQHITENDQYVVIHSALHRLRLNTVNPKWQMLRWLNRLVREGKTIVIPSFTFSFTKTGYFNWPAENSEAGILGNWAMQLNNAVRTFHPIYSFVCIGKDKDGVLGCDTQTAFGVDSVFGYLCKQKTKILMLGAGWENCTQFHYFEQKHKVPYRYHKVFQGSLESGDSSERVSTSMYVRDLESSVTNDFSLIVAELNKRDQIRRNPKSKSIESVSLSDLGRVCDELLGREVYALVKNRECIRFLTRCKQIKLANTPLRLLIYGSQNNDMLASIVDSQFSQSLTDRFVEVSAVPINKTAEQLYKSTKEPEYDIVISVERIQDLLVEGTERSSIDVIMTRVKSYAKEMYALSQSVGKLVIVNLFCRPPPELLSGDSIISVNSPRNIVNCANDYLIERLGAANNILLLDIEELNTVEGYRPTDERLFHHGRIPFGETASTQMAKKWLGCYLSQSGRTVRILILDLDNTLWGGVIGEDGIDGISLGGDYPGNAYQAFQESLKRLNERGLALGIISKNSEDDAFTVIDNHPEMVLRRDNFVSTRINWEDKVTNIIDIASEVGLSLENVGFVDDNPVEREKMRQQLPQVKVFEIGSDPTEYSRILYSDPFLHITEVTEEDKLRAKSYSDKAKLINQKTQFSSMEDFYRDLDVKIFIQNVDQYNIARAHQLVQKTNQFNATGMRYTKSELLSLGKSVIVVAASDKYSKRENLGIVVANETTRQRLTVSTFLLSCRALGKTIEKAIFEWLIREAVKSNLETVVFEFTKTERNRPVEELYKAAHMELCKDSYILNDIDRVKYDTDWVTIVDERGVDHT